MEEIRSTVRELLSEWDYAPRSDAWMRAPDPAFSRELGRRGLIGLTFPADAGGPGRSNVERLAATEELLRGGAPVGAHWVADRQIGPSLLRHGSDELRDELLPGILAGEVYVALGMSEPGAGSDLASVQTTATRVDGGWRVDGRKIWTGFAHLATHLYLLVRTGPGERKHEGLTEMIADMDAGGITVEPIWDLSGTHRFNDVRLDGVFVPDRRVVGTAGDGWRQVTEQLAFERGGPERMLSVHPLLEAIVGAARGAADLERLGELVARLGVLRRMCLELAEAMDEGRPLVIEAATSKLLGTAYERDVIELGRRVLGAGDRRFAEALQAQPGLVLRGGSEDVLLDMVARAERREAGASGAGDPVVETIAAGAREVPPDPRHAEVDAAARAGDPAALTAVIDRVLALTRTHVSTRRQFGAQLLDRPAVQRNLALMRVELLRAQAAVRRADARADSGALLAARITCAAAATETARLAHLLHGALGTTRAHPLHHSTLVLWAGRDVALPAHEAAAELGARAAAGGEREVWEQLAAP